MGERVPAPDGQARHLPSEAYRLRDRTAPLGVENDFPEMHECTNAYCRALQKATRDASIDDVTTLA